MSKKQYPSIEYIRQCFRYENGKLFWLERPLEHFKRFQESETWNKRYAGKETGCINRVINRAYVSICDKLFLRSRVVWTIHNGKWPVYMIDHINHITTDDRIENLREATRQQNMGNSNKYRNNTSGFKGVSWDKKSGKWDAYIRINKINKHLGYFDSLKDAAKAYNAAAHSVFGEYAFLNQGV